MNSTMPGISAKKAADQVQELAREVSELYGSYYHLTFGYETLMQKFLLEPNPQFKAYTSNRAYSLDNDLIRLQTAVTVIMHLANLVRYDQQSLEDRAGYILRYKLDFAVRSARRLVDAVAKSDPSLKSSATLFCDWRNAGRELIWDHPLFDAESTELL